MKLCFVTVGATASFKKLIYHVFTDEFLTALKEGGFTHLLVQYGKDGERFYNDFLDRNPSGSAYLRDLGLSIGGFDFKPSLDTYFAMAAKIYQENQEQGLVISHAGKIYHSLAATLPTLPVPCSNDETGTGSVLAAMRSDIPLVIVPNGDLADNHQEELADALSELGYAHKATPE